ncbi:zinc-ribbon domain-containing protein [Streptomyces sp. CA-250714]|uniref:zinc-ribbon domain-containing protein n=1 Tax=Streptomyces sp. CA-250714 TaxID=3240060 RepID=UPI003D902B7A
MIIFGTSSKLVQLAMLNLLCGFCGNPAAHALRKRVTKFSLFFIPLFPIAPAKHSLQCTFCGAQSEVSKENAEQMLAQAQGAPPAGQPAPGQGTGGVPQQPGAQSGNPFAGQQPQNPYQS